MNEREIDAVKEGREKEREGRCWERRKGRGTERERKKENEIKRNR